MTNAYVCVELAPIQNGYVSCKVWAVMQSPLNDLAITGDQAIQLSLLIASLLVSVKLYRIVMYALKSI